MINIAGRILLLSVCLAALIACEEHGGENGLPPDPRDWVCESSLIEPTEEEIEQFCASADHGLPAPDFLRDPSPISRLDDKNSYDTQMQDFLRVKGYVNELGWPGDLNWRLTGPYVGPIGSGQAYGVHPAVRLYYSPEVVDWLCGGRVTEIPDGAIIVKEMHSINASLGITLDSEGCMVIGADVEPDSWTIMIKQKDESLDGWYWGNYIIEYDPPTSSWQVGNPPIFDRSAVTSDDFFGGQAVPLEPNPLWYPTGYVYESSNKIPDIVPAFSDYGNYCINCHASADTEQTFTSLDNILTPGIRYKHYGSIKTSGVERSYYDLGPVYGPGGIALRDVPPGLKAEGEVDNYDSPFSEPLPEPAPAFLAFYDQLGMVTFPDVWDLRLPAETYDHIVSASAGPDEFITSDQCAGCHDGTISNSSLPNMILEEPGPDGTNNINLSPYSEWKASPMGLAGRDPVFFSQLESETNNLPELTECIESTCLHCHGVMGQRQLAIDTEGQDNEDCKSIFAIEPPPQVPFGKPFRLDMVKQWPGSVDNEFQKYGALARDGISCNVCHHISSTDLGNENTFTGNFVTGPPDEMYGPYEDSTIITRPMVNALGITPKFADYFVSGDAFSSDTCGSCHNILLPIFSNEGELLGASYEQATHLEWINSEFAPGRENFKSCADCHMPAHYKGEKLSFKIANIESNEFAPTTNRLPDEEITLTERDNFARHSLHGLNIFLNEMFQQFPLILGYRQIDVMTGTFSVPGLITGRDSMVEMARNETAVIGVETLETTPDGRLRAVVRVDSLVGHYLPTGVGFRRMFIEFLVRDAEGNVLWASGRTNGLGAIVKGTTNEILPSEEPINNPDDQFQPHYQTITRDDQAQIYEEVIEDSEGNVTTSFLRRANEVKDNRIRPKGFDPAVFNSPFFSPYIQALAVLHGEERFDPHYTDIDLTGSDVIEYLVTLDSETLSRVRDVQVTLYYQAIPPSYLQERFMDASAGPAESDEIKRLYYITSHLNVNDAADGEGRDIIQDWKLPLTGTTRALD
jgi:hypothetical protein